MGSPDRNTSHLPIGPMVTRISGKLLLGFMNNWQTGFNRIKSVHVATRVNVKRTFPPVAGVHPQRPGPQSPLQHLHPGGSALYAWDEDVQQYLPACGSEIENKRRRWHLAASPERSVLHLCSPAYCGDVLITFGKKNWLKFKLWVFQKFIHLALLFSP